MSSPRLGIDIGGTFTDFVLWQEGKLSTHKVLSTPAAPEQAILQGIRELGLSLEGLSIVHGSTIATNAVLERSGARTVFITNRGFRDLLLIGRQTRPELYNLTPKKPAPLIDAELCLEIDCRMAADGTELVQLDDKELQRIIAEVEQCQPQAVAICLLFAYLDGHQEQQLAKAMPADWFISTSHSILREYREFERGMTTWLNSYVGPLVQDYLQTLEAGLAPASLSVLRSSGQTCSASEAGQEAVHLLLSGPAGGLRAAELLHQHQPGSGLLTFDMGGTSTDVALFDGHIPLTNRGEIAGYPVAVPMTAIHTIGAGGGSIAYLDAGGALQVGPRSAGADPGPVCYGCGGDAVTVTDANLILGRIPSSTRLAGNLALDVTAAQKAMQSLATAAGLPDIETLALGIIRIANQAMGQALSRISVEQGKDPRSYTLVAFGGAGGLHVCALAESLGIEQAMVPVSSGVLSALGMIAAPRGRELSRTVQYLVEEPYDVLKDNIELGFQALQQHGEQALEREGIKADELQVCRSLDLCFQGQAFTLNIPWTDIEGSVSQFKQQYQHRYGYVLDTTIECVNLRLGLEHQASRLNLPEWQQPTEEKMTASGNITRAALCAQQPHEGPLVITDAAATTWVAAGWQASLDDYGNIKLRREAAP